MTRKQRERQIKNRIKIGAIVLGVTSVIITGVSIHNKVQAEKTMNNIWSYVSDNEDVQYTSIYIEAGENLTTLSKRVITEYNMDIPTSCMMNQIYSINKLGNPDYIEYGSYVVVPYIVEK